MSKIKAYVSHSIRGKFGVDATDEQMKANNDKAIKFGNYLRVQFPHITWYVPGDHDEFVLIAYRKKYMSEEEILDVDCTIIDSCNFMVMFSPDAYISRGMQVEIDHCMKHRVPIVTALDSGDAHVKKLVYSINCQLTSMMR